MKAKHSILVVEDDDQLRKIVHDVLDSTGLLVISVDSAVDAVLKLRNQKFSCVVLDMKLKKGTGDQVVAFMRRDQKEFNFFTPIVVISGNISKDLVSKIGGDISAVLVKPFDKQMLLEKIHQILSQADQEEVQDDHNK